MNIFFTLDYELFMGNRTGDPLNCLIQPMDAMCEMADRLDFKYVIFVDAAYLLKLSEEAKNSQTLSIHYNTVVSHLKQLTEKGHDIEFHFHPQWLYSTFDEVNQRWIMDRDHYKLSDMPSYDLNSYFPKSKQLLDSIINRKTIAFRAGGYSLTSLEGYYKLLMENGILIDSSVNSRRCVSGKYQEFNYSLTPKKTIWRFKESVDNVVQNGGIIEIPISYSQKYPGFIYLFKKYILIKKFGQDHRWFVGSGEESFLSRRKRLKLQLRKFINGMTFTASMDFFMSKNLCNLYRKFKKQGRKNMVIIGHPKNASPESIYITEEFIRNIKSSDKIKTFKEIMKN